MNFPTWPCNFPQKAQVTNDEKATEKISKKISTVAKNKKGNLLKDLSEFEKYKTIENLANDPISQSKFLKSLDNYLNDLTLKQLSLTKLAEGSYIMNFDIDDPAILFKEA
jgi:hypothetical protein